MNLISNFNLSKTIAKNEILKYENILEVIPNIKNIILSIGKTLGDNYEKKGEDIWISKLANVSETAYINGPCIIDDYVEIRHCAYIRGGVLIGKNSVVGNSVELKNCILFDNVQVPHFNYIGDSILGYKAHFGAGAITSNVKSDKSNIVVDGVSLKKIGAIVGDKVGIGCNSVICPGTIIGRNTTIYPLISARGVIEKDSIVKNNCEIIKKKQVYLDFDSTVYNTDKLFIDILNKCEEYGIKKEQILNIKQKFREQNKLFNIFEILNYINNNIDKKLYEEIENILKNGEQYIYGDVYQFILKLKEKKYEVNILTYGEKIWQDLKIDGCKIRNYVDEVFISEKEKNNLDYISYNSSVFIDDNPKELLSFLSKNPLKVIRIRRKDAGNSKEVLENKDIIECESLIEIIDLF